MPRNKRGGGFAGLLSPEDCLDMGGMDASTSLEDGSEQITECLTPTVLSDESLSPGGKGFILGKDK